jgi:hypothetical protein
MKFMWLSIPGPKLGNLSLLVNAIPKAIELTWPAPEAELRYRQAPTRKERERLAAKFDTIFSTQTGDDALMIELPGPRPGRITR